MTPKKSSSNFPTYKGLVPEGKYLVAAPADEDGKAEVGFTADENGEYTPSDHRHNDALVRMGAEVKKGA